MLCRALLQYVNDDAENVVLMENSSSEVFVAIGEYKSSDYTPDRFDSNSGGGGRLIRVVLKACTQPDAILPYPVLDGNGEVLCRTLGEAFKKKLLVWWMEGDAVATCSDGATHTP
jgi:hypothetical protein